MTFSAADGEGVALEIRYARNGIVKFSQFVKNLSIRRIFRQIAIPYKAVGWQSGLTRRTRNAVGEKSPHRFESCTLRSLQEQNINESSRLRAE